MSEIDVLVDELQRAHDGDPWHGPSARAVLRDVTAKEAAARPIPGAHTIWEIVLHLTAWTNEVARRLVRGVRADPEEGDWPPVVDPSEAGWKRTLEAHDAARRRLLGELSKFAPVRLGDQLKGGGDQATGAGMTYALMLHGTAQHDAYHVGQVALLKRAVRGA